MSGKHLVLTALLVFSACRTVSAKDQEISQAHVSVAQQSLSNGDPRGALAEVEKAVEADPDNAEAHNLYGLLLHLYFGRYDAAADQYKKAIELKPEYSEAKVNLGAVLTTLDRCQEAIPYLEQARKDLLYREPYLAENNLGWCMWKTGNTEGAITHLRAALANNPNFCLGYRNLAEIAESQGQLDESLKLLDRYATTCPTVADADYRRGLVQLKRGDNTDARQSFVSCTEKAKGGELAETCSRQAELIPEE